MRERVRLLVVGASSVLVLSALLVITPASGASSTPASTATAACGSWHIAPSPTLSAQFNSLVDVVAISDSNVWAVGGTNDPSSSTTSAIIEHWDGVSWTVVPSPAMPNSYLSAVAAVSARNIWAVGQKNSSQSGSDTLVEHWNGNSWTVVPSPNGPLSQNSLFSAVAFSGSRVWASGLSRSGDTWVPLVERWDGTAWSLRPAPAAHGTDQTYYGRIAGTSNSDLWFGAAYTTIEGQAGWTHAFYQHWDGTTWKVAPSPPSGTGQNFFPYRLVSIAPDDVWAVGSFSAGGNRHVYGTYIAHWDGSAWATVPTPNPIQSSGFSGVSASSATDVWAVGPGITERWDGYAWSPVAAETDPGTTFLTSVSVLPDGRAWAVGESRGIQTSQPLIESYCPLAPSGSDLGVIVQGSPNPATTGSTVTYQILVTNHGPMALSQSNITDSFDRKLTNPHVEPSQGTCAVVGAKAQCDLGPIAVGQTATVTLTATAPLTRNYANVAQSPVAADDQNPLNNRDTYTVVVSTIGAPPEPIANWSSRLVGAAKRF